MAKLQVRILERAKKYIERLSSAEQGTLQADMDAMESGDSDSVSTKQLRGPIRELIFGYHRLIYFKLDEFLWFVSGFRKKTNRTPKKEIDYANDVYNIVKNQERPTARKPKNEKNHKKTK